MELLKSDMGRILVESHRGIEGALPENTLAAIQAAHEQRADFIEVDVQLSADGVPFLFHNYGFGDGNWWHLTNWQDIRAKLVDKQPVTRLKDALSWARDVNARLSLDLKTGFHAFGRVVDIVVSMIDEYECWDNVMLLSWDHQELLEIKASHPLATTRILCHGRPVDIAAQARAAKSDAVSLNYGVARPSDIAQLHSNGIAVALAGMWDFDLEMIKTLDVDIVCWGQPMQARKALELE